MTAVAVKLLDVADQYLRKFRELLHLLVAEFFAVTWPGKPNNIQASQSAVYFSVSLIISYVSQ